MSLNLAGTAVRNFADGKDTKISPKIGSNEDFVVGESFYQGEKLNKQRPFLSEQPLLYQEVFFLFFTLYTLPSVNSFVSKFFFDTK